MPPASRTTSTQATPKINKGKAPQSPSHEHGEVEDTLLNGMSSPERRYVGPQFSDDALFSDGSPPRKSVKDKTKAKSKKKEEKVKSRRQKRPSSWLDLFSRMFILGFLIYSLSICPTADLQASPVCRALSEYRRLILEPYVINPVQNLLLHPSVSPYTTPVIEKARPIISRSQEEWNSRVVPQWNAKVVPQWEKHVVPQWRAHVSPQLARLDTKLDPYRQRTVEAYNKHGAPYVKQARMLLYKTRPYVILTAARTYDTYQASKPYLSRFYEQLQRLPPLLSKYVIRPLASARRQFVDPHVALLWEKIEELSSGTKEPHDVPDASVEAELPVATSSIVKEAEGSSLSVEVEVPVVTKTSVGDEPLASAESVASASLSLELTTTKGSAETASSTFVPSEEPDNLSSASSVMSGSLVPGSETSESVPGATYSPQPGATSETNSLLGDDSGSQQGVKIEPKTVGASLDNDVENSEATAPSIRDDASEVAEEISASINIPKPHRPPQPVHSSASVNEDDDLDQLLAELELDVEETISSDPPSTSSVIEETEEQKAAREAARLAEVAEKRRELTARHTRWEEKLADTISAQSASLKEAITSIRRVGAAELKINLAIRAAIQTLHTEAEKALRGTDAYFTKLRVGGKPRAEQARLWDRVLEKVQAKFDERVDEVEETVNKWYQEEVLSKEGEEIEKASATVRNVADEAQADIGLDYAWLDDVTYLDWRRYHALLDTHQAFLDETLALANGSHENAFPNVVLDAFEDLQAEVRDITLGFETRMRRIKREGERAFAEEQPEAEQPEPEVSILPVPNDDQKENAVLQEVADAIVGRSEEEVEAALNRANEQQEKAAHVEL
ncbi:uncharacterized protein FOMMEDRAFT_16301 [Fomitiporia mediterranea MF3/22]|uniref:uncharacterized protein n=1 Tax=Fomitiporia mediterranea (strain MF3/22) TaxID=694068 RepID=UPI000440967A|nr:uncharacterized protein FOMMEDRAFT_16301 [Fomitiporia mediterranea MF3/22]EJD07672.1 hypothetical protein FOMMEDRAFT_16301 [Fomitiporia mediterranea MF3/22]